MVSVDGLEVPEGRGEPVGSDLCHDELEFRVAMKTPPSISCHSGLRVLNFEKNSLVRMSVVRR